MFDIILQRTSDLFAAIPFSGPTIFVLLVLGFFIWLFVKADRDPHSPIAWEDLIVDVTTNRASPYNVGYLLGLIVGTWIVVVLLGQGKLGLDMFGAYLTYLLGGTGAHLLNNNKRPPLPPPDDTPSSGS